MTLEELTAAFRNVHACLLPGGGFLFASVHNIGPEVPPENVVALFDAALEHGRYT